MSCLLQSTQWGRLWSIITCPVHSARSAMIGGGGHMACQYCHSRNIHFHLIPSLALPSHLQDTVRIIVISCTSLHLPDSHRLYCILPLSILLKLLGLHSAYGHWYVCLYFRPKQTGRLWIGDLINVYNIVSQWIIGIHVAILNRVSAQSCSAEPQFHYTARFT